MHGIEVTNVRQICDKFNSHFTMNPKSIHDFNPSPKVNFELTCNSNSMYLPQTTESEVLAETKNLKENDKIN